MTDLMQARLLNFGGSGTALVLAHANGFPPGSYRQFAGALTAHCAVSGFLLRPLWSEEPAPQRLPWDLLATDLIETLAATQQQAVWMMGHSVGAVIAVQAAHRRPDLFRGLLLLDPVFIHPLRHALATLSMWAGQIDRMPLIRKTLSRPNHFNSRREAQAFHRGKRAYRNLSDAVLRDYIEAATRPGKAGGWELSYAREWEVAVYRSVPQVWGKLKQLRLPVLGLRGRDSQTLTARTLRTWQRVQPQADLRECRGGHLLPLEYPADTAAQVLDFLRCQGAI